MATTQEAILFELKGLAEDSYKEFNKGIVPTDQITLGVRIPVLRKIAKRIAGTDPLSFIASDKGNVYEMVMLEGMTISYMDQPFSELQPLIESFLEKVDNWAQIDSTICDCRNIAKEKGEVLSTVKSWLQSEAEFTVRAGLVMLLAHFVEKQFLNTIFSLSQSVRHKGYYVSMANGWLISVCMAKYPAETILFFESNSLDDITHNRAIQKCRESRRVSEHDKAVLLGLKRKINKDKA